MKKFIAALIVPLLLSACQSIEKEQQGMEPVTTERLQHHNWQLTAIDGKTLMTPEQMQPPRLEIGENMKANGNAGCNNFSGKAELKDDRFRIVDMLMTMKMCFKDAMDNERAMAKTLPMWSEISLTKDTLTLKGSEHTLTFTLSDWK